MLNLDLHKLDENPNKELITNIKPEFQTEGEETRQALMNRINRSRKLNASDFPS